MSKAKKSSFWVVLLLSFPNLCLGSGDLSNWLGPNHDGSLDEEINTVKKNQELEPTYRINGAIMFLDVKQFLKTKSYFDFPIETFIMSKEKSIDVDTLFDFKLAEHFLMQRNEV